MLTNLMVNATVAILDMPASAVLAHPGLFRLEIAMLHEALAVMKAQGIRVVDTPKTPVRLLVLAAYLPAFISRPDDGQVRRRRTGRKDAFLSY